MGRSRRSVAPRTDLSVPFMVVTCVVTVVCAWFGVPAGVVCALGLCVSGFMAVRPEFTGPKDVDGYATPVGVEQKKFLRFQFFAQLRWRVFVPNVDWWCGWPVRVSTLVCAGVGGVVFFQPLVLPLENTWVHLVNGVLAYGACCGVTGSLRRYASEFGARPAVTVRDVVEHSPVAWWIIVTVAVLAGVLAGVGVWVWAPYTRVDFVSPWVSVPVAVTVAGVIVNVVVRGRALTRWRELVDQRSMWKPRWESLKLSARLEAYERHGSFQVMTFSARNANDVRQKASKIPAEVGGGETVAVISHPNMGSDGQEIPGTVHPNLFRIVTWPASETPSIEEATEDEQVRLILHSAVWESRWVGMKKWEAHPIVSGVEVIDAPSGQGTVVTFDVPQTVSIVDILDTPKTFELTVGQVRHGFMGAFVPCPEVDGAGQPVVGSQSATRFQYVELPDGESVANPEVSREFVYQWVRVALMRLAVANGGRPAEVTGVENVSGLDGYSAWKVTVEAFIENAMPLPYIDVNFADEFFSGFGADGFVVSRSECVLGLFDVDGFTFTDQAVLDSGKRLTLEDIENAQIKREWSARWTQLFDGNPGKIPTLKPNLRRSAKLADGTKVFQEGFVIRQGHPVKEFFALESKGLLPTVLRAAPFVSLAYVENARSDRPGERHPMGLYVHWAHAQVPTKPDYVTPLDSADQTANKWVLCALLRQGFASAKLADPQVFEVEPLSTVDSRSHLWRVGVRLYGGVTLGDVRRATPIIRRSLGSEYMRVGEGPDSTVNIVIGGVPESVEFERPYATDKLLADLDWEQAFIDAKVVNGEGVTPTLVSFERLEFNDKVMRVTFRLPSGVGVAEVRASVGKLSGATGYGFMQVKEVEGHADRVVIVCAEGNPMPTMVPYDPEFIMSSGVDVIPFGAGLEGEPAVFDIKNNTHLLVLGGQGSGKSVGLQALIVPALMKGLELFVADPIKGAADFQFLRPWSRIFVDEEEDGLFRVAAMLRCVYQLVCERKRVNAEHGAGNYRELPEEVRPSQALVVIDEFTSLVMLEPEPKQSSDPEVEADRELLLARNGARKEIAMFVGKIIREARSAGVSMLLATQKMSNDMLKGLAGMNDVKSNTATLILGKSKDTDRAAAGMVDPYGAPDLGESVPKGRGVFESLSGLEVVQVQFEPGGTDALAGLVGSVRAPIGDGERMDYSGFLRLPEVPDGPAVQALPPEEPVVVEDVGEVSLGDWDLDFGEMTESTEATDVAGGDGTESFETTGTVDGESVSADAVDGDVTESFKTTDVAGDEKTESCETTDTVSAENVSEGETVEPSTVSEPAVPEEPAPMSRASEVAEPAPGVVRRAVVWEFDGVFDTGDTPVDGGMVDEEILQATDLLDTDVHVWLSRNPITDHVCAELGMDEREVADSLTGWLNDHLDVGVVVFVSATCTDIDVNGQFSDVLSRSGRSFLVIPVEGRVEPEQLEQVDVFLGQSDHDPHPRVVELPGSDDEEDVEETETLSAEGEEATTTGTDTETVVPAEPVTEPENTTPDVDTVDVDTFIPDIPTIDTDDMFIPPPAPKAPRKRDNPFA